MTPNERALLMFLKTESPSIDPALQGAGGEGGRGLLSRIGSCDAGPMPASPRRSAVADAS